MAFASGRLAEREFTETIARLQVPEEQGLPAVPADRAVAKLRNFRATWDTLDELGEEGERLRADLVAAVYDEIVVRGDEFVRVTLTPDALASGFALALPERVSLARPEGFEPPTY